MSAPLADRFAAAPRPSQRARALKKLETLLSAEDFAPARVAVAQGKPRDLLIGLADHSPYLWSLLTENPGRAARLLLTPPDASLEGLVAALHGARFATDAEIMTALRRAKREAALLVALADIGGVWGVEAATEACKAAPPAPVELLTRDGYADGGWAWRN